MRGALVTASFAVRVREGDGMAFREWADEHHALWEFFKFNVLSNVSTALRFAVAWVGNALTGGIGGMVVTFAAELIAQVVNFFVQMKWVFKSTADFSRSAPKYAVLAAIIVGCNSFVVPRFASLLMGMGVSTGLVGKPVVGTLLAVVISLTRLYRPARHQATAT